VSGERCRINNHTSWRVDGVWLAEFEEGRFERARRGHGTLGLGARRRCAHGAARAARQRRFVGAACVELSEAPCGLHAAQRGAEDALERRLAAQHLERRLERLDGEVVVALCEGEIKNK
jgi:hypothetical protein